MVEPLAVILAWSAAKDEAGHGSCFVWTICLSLAILPNKILGAITYDE
jgi:hypothetical protein